MYIMLRGRKGEPNKIFGQRTCEHIQHELRCQERHTVKKKKLVDWYEVDHEVHVGSMVSGQCEKWNNQQQDANQDVS